MGTKNNPGNFDCYANAAPAARCCECGETMQRYKRGFDHLRVALTQISRATRDGETADYALTKIREALAMVQPADDALASGQPDARCPE